MILSIFQCVIMFLAAIGVLILLSMATMASIALDNFNKEE